MELIPILSRAEALFHRFGKKVEAIDKRYNFPPAPARQRKVATTGGTTESQPPDTSQPEATSSSVEPRPGQPPQRSSSTSASGPTGPDCPPQQQQSQAPAVDKERVITPELRRLLSRKLEVMDAADVRKHGGGT